MTELTANPSRMRRLAAFVLRAAFWFVASAWIALGMVWVVLHFVIVPRIAEFRPMLEQEVSRVLGMPVHIGNIVARSNGLIPSMYLGMTMGPDGGAGERDHYRRLVRLLKQHGAKQTTRPGRDHPQLRVAR